MPVLPCHRSPSLSSVAWRLGFSAWVGLLALNCSLSCLKLVKAPLEARLLYMYESQCRCVIFPKSTEQVHGYQSLLIHSITVISLWLCNAKMPPEPPAGHSVFWNFPYPTWSSYSTPSTEELHCIDQCSCQSKCPGCYPAYLTLRKRLGIVFLVWGGPMEALSRKSSPKGCGICLCHTP